MTQTQYCNLKQRVLMGEIISEQEMKDCLYDYFRFAKSFDAYQDWLTEVITDTETLLDTLKK